jgi:hypothetical protein
VAIWNGGIWPNAVVLIASDRAHSLTHRAVLPDHTVGYLRGMKIYFGFTVAGDRSTVDTARKVVQLLEERGHRGFDPPPRE